MEKLKKVREGYDRVEDRGKGEGFIFQGEMESSWKFSLGGEVCRFVIAERKPGIRNLNGGEWGGIRCERLAHSL